MNMQIDLIFANSKLAKLSLYAGSRITHLVSLRDMTRCVYVYRNGYAYIYMGVCTKRYG